MINLTLVQNLVLLKYPPNHGQNSVQFQLNYRICRALLWKNMKQMIKLPDRRRNPKMVVKGEAVGCVDAAEVGGFEQNNELLNSSVGVNPLHIGYNVEGFDNGNELSSDFGNGQGGEGDGGHGSGGNDGQGDAGGSEANDEQTGLEWWWLWQWNRAIRHRKTGRSILHFTYNDRDKLLESAILMLAAEVMPPTDMAKAALDTMRVIEDLLPLLLQVLMFPIVFPVILSDFKENEALFAAIVYGIFGASVLLAAVFSGAVLYGLWRWHDGLWDCDSGEDDTGQE